MSDTTQPGAGAPASPPGTVPPAAVPGTPPAATPGSGAPQVVLTQEQWQETQARLQALSGTVGSLKGRLDKLASPQAGSAPEHPPKPTGTEERIAALEKELAEQRTTAERERFGGQLARTAAELGVRPDALEFLEFQLRREHPELTADGAPDPAAEGRRIPIRVLVETAIKRSPATYQHPRQPPGGPALTGSATGAAVSVGDLDRMDPVSRWSAENLDAMTQVRKSDPARFRRYVAERRAAETQKRGQ